MAYNLWRDENSKRMSWINEKIVKLQAENSIRSHRFKRSRKGKYLKCKKLNHRRCIFYFSYSDKIQIVSKKIRIIKFNCIPPLGFGSYFLPHSISLLLLLRPFMHDHEHDHFSSLLYISILSYYSRIAEWMLCHKFKHNFRFDNFYFNHSLFTLIAGFN
jgi:hypothetical protein